jgi:hypothetical protein
MPGLLAAQAADGAKTQWGAQDTAAPIADGIGGNDLTTVTGTLGVAGPLGGTAVEFNGTSASYASYTGTTTGDMANMFASSGYATFETWVRLDSAANNTYPTLWANWNGSAAGTGWIFSLYCADYFSVTYGKPTIQVQTDSGLYTGQANFSTGSGIEEGSGWHHVVLATQINNTDANGYVLLDGTQYTLNLTSSGNGTYLDDSNLDMYMGRRYDISSGKYLDGALAAAATYDFRLDPATALSHYQETSLNGGGVIWPLNRRRRR